MEVESEDEDDGREDRNDGQPSQPDQDTQVQDMDEVGADEVIRRPVLQTIHLWKIVTRFISYWYYWFVAPFCISLFFKPLLFLEPMIANTLLEMK